MPILNLKISSFVRHLATYGAAEVSAKLSRLAVVVVIARTMDPYSIGLAAAAMAASDILKSLTENGVSQRIIKASEDELDAVCLTARRIFWIWCLGLFVVQILIGALIFSINGNALIFAMISLLACEYLFMPGGLVSCALAMREGRLSATATIRGGHIVATNLLTAVLAFFWLSPLAIVLPKVLTAPFWLIAMRRLRPWNAAVGIRRAPLRPFVRFGAAVLGVEIVKAVRLQADKLVIGALLGAEALGYYFFAFNAGLGLATSFSAAFSTVLFPHLCSSENRERTLANAIMLAVLVLGPIVVLQAILAPVYVPIIFGERWTGLAGLVSILCLTAIPSIIWSAAAQWLRAQNRPGIEFKVTATLAVALVSTTALLAPHGLTAVAWGTLVVSVIVQIFASVPALKTSFHAIFPPRAMEA